jgi:hypothetical protein
VLGVLSIPRKNRRSPDKGTAARFFLLHLVFRLKLRFGVRDDRMRFFLWIQTLA